MRNPERRRERGEAIAIVGTAVRQPRGRRRNRATTGRAAGEQLRESVVQPAQRSPAAHRKAASKRTDDDLPVHSFRGLVSELGTLTANRVRMVDSGATFTMHSESTALQQRCFDLLGVSAQSVASSGHRL